MYCSVLSSKVTVLRILVQLCEVWSCVGEANQGEAVRRAVVLSWVEVIYDEKYEGQTSLIFFFCHKYIYNYIDKVPK